jgi:hypothetical protein
MVSRVLLEDGSLLACGLDCRIPRTKRELFLLGPVTQPSRARGLSCAIAPTSSSF